jgi:hypothetical protein
MGNSVEVEGCSIQIIMFIRLLTVQTEYSNSAVSLAFSHTLKVHPQSLSFKSCALTLPAHILGTALLNRLFAMSSNSWDMTTRPFRAFSKSFRLCLIVDNSRLYLVKKKRKFETRVVMYRYYNVQDSLL